MNAIADEIASARIYAGFYFASRLRSGLRWGSRSETYVVANVLQPM